MSLGTAFETLSVLAETSGAAGIREAILDVAFQGTLVEQRADEEPGSALVERAQAVRKKAAPDRKNPDAACLALPIPPRPSPAGWAMTRLGLVARIVRGIRFPSRAKMQRLESGAVACLRTANIETEVSWRDLIYVPESLVRNDEHWVRSNDLIMSISNGPEKVGIAARVDDLSERATFGGFLAVIRPFEIDPAYLLYFLRASLTLAELRSAASRTTEIANIRLGALRALPVMVPPLAEQKRIVARIGALFAQCDEVDARHSVARETYSRFVRLTQDYFAAAADLGTSRSAHTLLIQAFHDLSRAPDGVIALRAVVLSLAVRGLLEPATSEPLLKNGAGPCPLPASWRWSRFGEIVKHSFVGLHRTNAQESPGGRVGYFKTSNISRDGGCSLSRVSRVDATPEELAAYRLSPGDFLLSKLNSPELVGMTCVFPRVDADEFVFSKSILKVQFVDGVDARFVHWWCCSPSGRNEMAKLKSSTTRVVTLGMPRLRSLPVPLPPLAVQQRIAAQLETLLPMCDELRARLDAQNELCTRMSDFVAPWRCSS